MMKEHLTKTRDSIYRIILLTGLLAGTLDIVSAFLNFLAQGGDDPRKVLVFIASGVFGQRAFEPSYMMFMSVSGLVFHYLIALIWTTLYFMTYPRIHLLSSHKYLNGMAYGLIVWIIMNLVVLPLSGTPEMELIFKRVAISMGILIVAIGLPISLVAHNYFRE